MSDLNLKIYGGVMSSANPLNFRASNIHVDNEMGSAGFIMDQTCNYPEAALETEVLIENCVFERVEYGSPRTGGFIHYSGAGNLTVRNNTVSQFYPERERYLTIKNLLQKSGCRPVGGL